MVNLKNERIWVRQDLIKLLRTTYHNDVKNMTNDTMVNWLLSNLVLLEEPSEACV